MIISSMGGKKDLYNVIRLMEIGGDYMNKKILIIFLIIILFSFRNVPHFDGIWSKSLANNKRSRREISNFLEYKEISQSTEYKFNTNCEQLE